MGAGTRNGGRRRPTMETQGSSERPSVRPTRGLRILRAMATPLWRASGYAGVLEVVGRRTGAPVKVTLVPAKVDGAIYLIAFGGHTHWSRNLTAAGRGVLQIRRKRRDFVCVEVAGDERERAIASYLSGIGPVKYEFLHLPEAADHPTFRLDLVD